MRGALLFDGMTTKERKDEICNNPRCDFTASLSMSLAEAQNKVVVIPMAGAVGDAVPGNVVKGKTFSSFAGKGLTGTLVLPPGTQTFTIASV